MKDYPEGAPDGRLTLKELPVDERPRERLLQLGPEALTDAELLAIIIRDGTRTQTALDLARQLLTIFEGLQGIKSASVHDLFKVKGIGPARAAQVLAALALASRIAETPLKKGRKFTHSRAVYDHFRHRVRDLKQECIYCLLLDAKNRVQREAEVSKGGLSAAMAHPRDILTMAIRESAHAIILVHNHPSGDPTPSSDDIRLTERVRQTAETAGIRFLDHVIIGENGYVSLADEGRLRAAAGST